MSNPNKKSKTSEEAELDIVRNYLLACPLVPKNSRAMQVCMEALLQEGKRMERDAKLKRKFANNNKNESTTATQQSTTANATANGNNKTSSTTPSRAELQQQQQQQDEAAADDAELMMEWQDVAPSPENIVETPSSFLEGSILGKTLAQSSIASMANSKTTVASPLSAIALALHAALCSDTLGFKCTGIPNDTTASSTKSNGFAPPIRELPKTQLVPQDWDKHSVDTNNPSVKLRYRKDAVGSTVVTVSLLKQDDNATVQVELAPSTSKEPLVFTFPLQDHVNLDSLAKALTKSGTGRVVPTLHYKALPVLLTNMCNTFDLGPVQDAVADAETTTTSTQLPYVDTTIVAPSTYTNNSSTIPVGLQQRRHYNPHETPTIRDFQPELRRPGDFDCDLMPGGVDMPGGNLMGPNHPAFRGGPSLVGSGYGMRPRFDPFGPPGGPQDPRNLMDPNNNGVLDPNDATRRNRPRPPPGGTGDPNPDHARPPNDLGNNMFM